LFSQWRRTKIDVVAGAVVVAPLYVFGLRRYSNRGRRRGGKHGAKQHNDPHQLCHSSVSSVADEKEPGLLVCVGGKGPSVWEVM
jgi:hypothetical protein